MNKHTPGPWTSGRPFPDDLDDYGTGIWVYAADAGGFMSSLASVRYGCTEAAEVGDIEANARLIAAAPTMLAALEETRDFLMGGNSLESADPWVRELISDTIDPAIARARGES